ncbi:MAG: Gfo/Idh/MocA family protein [Methylococcales bacterium]
MKIAVFGAGVIGKLRCRSVIDNGNTELVGAADKDLQQALAATRGTNAVAVVDYRELLQNQSVDAVIVCSPIHLHEEMCLAAFEAGCHVLCEKPLSNSLDSCRRILQAAKDASRTLAVGFNHRYYPSVQFLTKTLKEGLIGAVDHLRVFGGHDGLGSFREDWMYKGAVSGGGTMMDVGIHMTDLVNFVAGNVVEVSAVATDQIWRIEGSEDNAIAVMRTSRDIPVIYQATWTEWKGYRIFLEAYGDKGMVRAYYAPMFNLLITQDKPGGKRKRKFKIYPEIMIREKLRGWESTTLKTFEQELADFLGMVKGEAVTLADGAAGLLAVEVAQAVYCSSREHRTVTIGG